MKNTQKNQHNNNIFFVHLEKYDTGTEAYDAIVM